MWLATRLGYFSIVKKEDGVYHIRARAAADLDQLRRYLGKPSLRIHLTPSADYPARICTASADMISDIFIALAADIQYSNFKSAIGAAPAQRDKLPWYHEIWTTMREWQLRVPRQQTPSAPPLSSYTAAPGELF